MSGVVLHLFALDNSLTIVPGNTLPLTNVTSDSNGHFSMDTTGCCSAQLSTLQNLAAADSGSVEMELYGASTDNGLLLNDFPVSLTSYDPSGPVFTPESGNLSVTGLKLQTGRGLVQTVSTLANPGPFPSDDTNPSIGGPTKSTANTMVSNGASSPSTPADPPNMAQPSETPLAYCEYHYGGYIEWLKWDETTTRRIVHEQVMSTRGQSTVEFLQQFSHETAMGAAVTGAYSHFAAGMTHSLNETNTMGIDNITQNWRDVSLGFDWKYKRLRAYCNAGVNSFWMNAYKWVPYYWTLGNAEYSSNFYFDCNPAYREPIHGAVWVEHSTSEYFDNYFDILGVKLDSSHIDSENVQLRYRPDSGQTAYICGYQSSPAIASYIREVAAP